MNRRPHRTSLFSALALLAACSAGGDAAAPAPAQPFVVFGLQVMPGSGEATVAWSTSHPATAVVEWGESDLYGNSLPVLEAALDQVVVLGGLDPETTYHLRVVAVHDDGRLAPSDDLLFVTQAPGTFGSDDFDAANLDLARWDLIDPTGAAELRMVGAGSGAARVELEVPAGVESHPWTAGNGAARLMQAAPAGDWSVEARFEGGLSDASTGHGLLVEVDADTFLRFDFAFYSNKTHVFAALLDGGATPDTFAQTVQSGPWAAGDPLWMRVTRSGQLWSQEWSVDGQGWIPGAQYTLAAPPSRLGLHVVSAGTNPPGHTLVADYWFDVAAPIPFEDGATSPDQDAPLLYRAEAQPLGDDRVALRWWTDEPAGATLRVGLDTTYADGVVEVADALYEHTVLVTDLEPETTYHFQIVSRDELGHETTSSDLVATTYPFGESALPEIALWYGAAQPDGSWVARFGHLGNAQYQINLLGNVSDDDEERLVDHVSLYYQLNGGKWYALALGDDRELSYEPWRLANEGDFNLELALWELTSVPLVDGVHRNEVVLEALDDDGNATYQTVFIDYTPGVTWQPGTTDWSQLLADGGDLTDAVQVVDGDWYVDDHPTLGPGLRVRADSLGYDRLVAIGEGDGEDAWENYEVTVSGTVLGLDPLGWTEGTQSYAMGLALRWSGHTPGWGFKQPNHNIYPFGGIFIYRWFETSECWELWINKDETIVPFDAPVELGTTYVFKSRCETQEGGGTRYRLKRWVEGSPEPAGWDFDYTTPADQDHPTGSLLLISHHVDVLFGDVSVTQLP